MKIKSNNFTAQKKILSLLFSILLLIGWSNKTSAQIFEWAKRFEQANSTGSIESKDITVDASGNIYTIGLFFETYDFDPGPGTFYLYGNNFDMSLFVSKLDASGNFIWAKKLDVFWVESLSIVADSSGYIYFSGRVNLPADFDPGPGFYSPPTNGGAVNIFTCKWDSSGNFIWVKSIGNYTANGRSTSMELDNSGNIYTTGWFSGSYDFDPSLNSYFLTTPSAINENFIQKLDNSGNFLWAKSIGRLDTLTILQSFLGIDASGNIYTAGTFEGTADFDPDTGLYSMTASGSYDVFITKMNSSGNFIWAKKIGGTGNNAYTYDLSVDDKGNIYMVGIFNGTTDFDPDTSIFNLTSSGYNDVFITKLDSSGSLLWAKSIGGTGNDVAHSIATDALGNAYTTGFYTGTVDFDPDSIVYNLSSAISTYADMFISKLDALGNFVWAGSFTLIESSRELSITIDTSFNIYTTGTFYGPTDFDPDTGVAILPSSGIGNNDIFLLRLSQSTIACSVTTNSTNILCNGNCDGSIVAVANGVAPFQYLWSTGAGGALIDSLCAATYSVIITDSVGCSDTTTIVLTQPPPIVSTIVSDYSNCNCTFQVNATGGTPVYTYQWCNGSTVPQIINCNPGLCTVIVTDANGCIIQDTVFINPPPALATTMQTTSTTCIGCGDGVAIALPSGGTPPYTFNLVPSNCNNDTCTGLSAGIYTFNVTDSNGCTTSISDTVLDNPTAIMFAEENQSAKIYPNPFTNESILEINGELLSFQPEFILTDVLGNKVSSFVIEKQKTILGRKNLSAGIYFYQINSDSKNLVKGKLLVVD